MLQVARLSPTLLGDAADLTARFLSSRLNPDGGFQDRDGGSDLYYTVFGLEALIALRRDLPVTDVRRYLEHHEVPDDLDFVHTACVARCWADIGAANDALAEALPGPGRTRGPRRGTRRAGSAAGLSRRTAVRRRRLRQSAPRSNGTDAADRRGVERAGTPVAAGRPGRDRMAPGPPPASRRFLRVAGDAGPRICCPPPPRCTRLPAPTRRSSRSRNRASTSSTASGATPAASTVAGATTCRTASTPSTPSSPWGT